MNISTADIYDKYPNEVAICELAFFNYGARESFFGPCRTVKVFEDHVPVRDLLSEKGEGRVLIVDGEGSRRIGIVGDKMAAKAVDNGWAGVIVNGVIRDAADIRSLSLGVKALGTTARRAWANTQGVRDVPVIFGDVCFESGNWVYADADAVLVSRKELAIGSR